MQLAELLGKRRGSRRAQVVVKGEVVKSCTCYGEKNVAVTDGIMCKKRSRMSYSETCLVVRFTLGTPTIKRWPANTG